MLPFRRNAADRHVDFIGLAGRFLIDAAHNIPIETADMLHGHDAASQFIGNQNSRYTGPSKGLQDGPKLRQSPIQENIVTLSVMVPQII